jgi:hypothetical protein
MSQEEGFDSFYESTRRAVLVAAYALTGDRPAAEAAVRASYAQAWQRWRRVSALDDPLDWVQQRAWRIAERRHAATPGTDGPAVLSGLSDQERRQLARQVTVDSVPDRLASLAAEVAGSSYPDASVVRRAGRRRRRTRLWLGVAVAAVAALVVAGLAWVPGDQPDASSEPRTPARSASPSALLPVAEDLLASNQVRRLGGPRSRGWRVDRTDANTSGDGINSVCQQRRFADPSGRSALVRVFEAAGTTRRSAVQTVEVSRSVARARRTYLTTVGWYAGCQVARLRVLGAYRVDGVGDQAQVLDLRLAERPASSITVAVARTGAVVTSIVVTSVGADPPAVRAVVVTLADAVRGLCGRSVAGRCVTRPASRVVPPPPAGHGEARGSLAVADLPPVGRVDRPWVGTRPARPSTSSPVPCAGTDFRSAGAVRSRTRTYLIPQTALPDRFGLTETYGTFGSGRAAARFLATARDRLVGCAQRDVTTELGAERRRTAPRTELHQWLLTTTVSPSEKVRFRVGLVRVGRSVAQLTFAPTPGADLSDRAFGSLLSRAGDRLRELG